MANIEKIRRADVLVDIGDKPRKLKYTLNSFAEMEEKYGSVDDAMALMEKGSVSAIRFMLWVGLKSEDKTLTEEAVGDMIEIQDLKYMAEQMNKCMTLDAPVKDDSINPNDKLPTGK